MKLASLRAGRDGALVVVSRDLQRFLTAEMTLQQALDDWPVQEPVLATLSQRVNDGAGEPFVQSDCASPLPRAFQWADGSAYVNHVELVRKARGAEMPESFWTDPLMYQGGSDSFLGPRDPIVMDDVAWGIDFEGEVAVITGDVPMGASAAQAAGAIRLLMLVGVDMTFDFPTLIAHAAKTRPLAAGTIIGSGTVSNKGTDGSPGKPVTAGGLGYSCIAELRMIETLRDGQPSTAFMQFGDRVSIEMADAAGASIFGRIEQEVVARTNR